MRVLTILGTRPELIRLSLIIKKLDKFTDHVLVHTGQNYDNNLSKVFIDELGIREPDYHLEARGTFGEQLGIIATNLEKILDKEKPDAFLVLGDTNSSLGAIIAKRKGIRVFHMEAGNRCYDDRVPEETNRRLIDHSSDILLPYTERSRANLLKEGIPSNHIYVTGNPIAEVIKHYAGPNTIQEIPYYLVTLHRTENVDNPERLSKFIEAINQLDRAVIWPMHPHTRNKIKDELKSHIEMTAPVGFKEFIKLERSAYCVLTDSGTVQEECCLFHVPVVTLRDSTERPETLEVGSNFVAGCEPESILRGIKVVTQLSRHWEVPREYSIGDVSDTVVKLILGYYP